MNYNKHYDLSGKHAFLGASKYAWIRYDDAKLADTYRNQMATQRGTMLHDYACKSIELGITLPKKKQTLNMYVNDAIGYDLVPEQILYYSPNCFGTADTISKLDDVYKSNILRIHDLKTGITPASMDQLLVYSALFCLEYNAKPKEIKILCRIYQDNQVMCCEPTPEDVLLVMDKIVRFDKIITEITMDIGGALG